MRSYAPVLFTIGVFAALPASAEECTRTLATSVYSRYAFAELGETLYDKPVIQTDVALSCGDMTYELWNSSQFGGPGAYGHRGAGDEFDLTATWKHEYSTAFGPIAVEVSGAYWLIDSFSRMKDDYAAFHEQIGRPFVIDETLSITPYFRLSQWAGLTGQTYQLARPGVSASWTMAETWSLDADASWSADLGHHYETLNATFTVGHELDDGISVFASASVAEGMTPVFGTGLSKTF